MNYGMEDFFEKLKFDLVSYSSGPFPGAYAASKGGVLNEVKSIFERHRHRPHRRRHTVYLRLPDLSLVSKISVRIPAESAASINDVVNADFSFFVTSESSNVRRLSELYHETSPLSCSWIFRYTDASSVEESKLIPCDALVIESDICGHSFDNGSMILELSGTASPQAVQRVNQERAVAVVLQAQKMTLKYLRSNGHVDAYRALLSSLRGKLEIEIVTRLYEEFVTSGNYRKSEEIIQMPEFRQLLSQKMPEGTWKRLKMRKVSDSWPPPRGGHQIVTYNNKLYLHGGWTGNAEMGDFWEYDIDSNRWKLLSINTSEQDGPSPRCCHKLAVDNTTGIIYILGRYVDNIGQRKTRIPNDFYKYEIKSNKWTQISGDVEKEGGPPLIYDHQMVFSEKTGELLCFGGRVLQRTTRIEDFSLDDFQPQSRIRSNYGNFYKWNSRNNSWSLVSTMIVPRNSHAMTLDQAEGVLYIMGGLKSKTDLNDLIAYDLTSCTASTLHDGTGPGAPPCGLTQRAFFHQKKRQIRVIVGSAVQSSRTYKKSRNGTIDGLAMWIYSIDKKQWRTMKHNVGPISRRAHAVTNLSDSVTLLFGGNPGIEEYQNDRMCDFWCFEAANEEPAQVLFKLKGLLLESEFIGIKSINPTEALMLLRSNKSIELLSRERRESLAAQIFESSSIEPWTLRSHTFSKLMKLLNEDLVEPRANLENLITNSIL